MKKSLTIVGIALAILGGIYVLLIYLFRGKTDTGINENESIGQQISTGEKQNGTSDMSNDFCFKKYCFDIEIAKTNQERAKGLMYREYLPEMSGMLFVFDQPGIYGFWMKNTLIPLDMIWLDQEFNVVDIKYAVPCEQDPCPSYRPGSKGNYVLELNGGMSQKIGLQIGDHFVLHNLKF